jgi:hypothetical protein
LIVKLKELRNKTKLFLKPIRATLKEYNSKFLMKCPHKKLFGSNLNLIVLKEPLYG